MLLALTWYMLRKQPMLVGWLWSAAFDCCVRNRPAFNSVVTLTAFYLHIGPFADMVVKATREQIKLLDEGAWQPPQRVPIPPTLPEQKRARTKMMALRAS